MNALEKSLENAIENNGESTAANKAYLEFDAQPATKMP